MSNDFGIVPMNLGDYQRELESLVGTLEERLERIKELTLQGSESNDRDEELKFLFSNVRYLCPKGRILLIRMAKLSMTERIDSRIHFYGRMLDGISIDSNGLERLYLNKIEII